MVCVVKNALCPEDKHSNPFLKSGANSYHHLGSHYTLLSAHVSQLFYTILGFIMVDLTPLDEVK